MGQGGERMAQTERVSVLTSVHDRRLNEPMVLDKSVMQRLNEKLRGERAGRLSPDLTQLNRTIHYSYAS